MVGEEFFTAAEMGANDLSEFPLLAPVRRRVTRSDLRKLRAVKGEMDEIRAFVQKMDPDVDDLLKIVTVAGQPPPWWDWQCDRSLLFAVAQHGHLDVVNWVFDPARPFRQHFSETVIAAIEQAAGRRETQPIAVPDRLEYLFHERWRVDRCLAVLRAVRIAAQNVRGNDGGSETGPPNEFPMDVGYGTVLVSPGRFVVDDTRYSTKWGPCPAGFCIERTYRPAHFTTPLKFRAEIQEGENGPTFVVTNLTYADEVFQTDDPSEVWRQAFASAYARLDEATIPDEGPRMKSIGMTLFGLYNKKIRDELAKLENAESVIGLRLLEPETLDQQPFEIRWPGAIPPESPEDR
jgi:hypothetical protein